MATLLVAHVFEGALDVELFTYTFVQDAERAAWMQVSHMEHVLTIVVHEEAIMTKEILDPFFFHAREGEVAIEEIKGIVSEWDFNGVKWNEIHVYKETPFKMPNGEEGGWSMHKIAEIGPDGTIVRYED